MNLLIEFVLRLGFGLAVGMGITSSRQVTSGYFRNHLYVTLGLATLAAMVSYAVAPQVFWWAVAAAIASYVGSVFWLYERSRLGKVALLVVALASLGGAIAQQTALRGQKEVAAAVPASAGGMARTEQTPVAVTAFKSPAADVLPQSATLGSIAVVSSGLLLGITIASMLLGHWYLNSPSMELVPLRRLIMAIGAAVLLQTAVSGLGLWGELTYQSVFSTQWVWFVVLRWSFGLIGVAVLAWMAWETLKVPNTQSATGILYVAVIGTFVGETMALLLSAESLFPL